MAKKTSAAAVPSAFDAATVIELPVKASSSKKAVFQIEGVADYVDMRRFAAMAIGSLDEFETRMKEKGTERYLDIGVDQGTTPDNFSGAEGTDEMMFVFSKRRSNVYLSDEEAELFDDAGLPYDTNTKPESFSFRSAYMDDPVWRAKIAEQLAPLMKGDLPYGTLIEKTPASTVRAVNYDTVKAIFTAKDRTIAERFLPMVTTLGLKVSKKAISITDLPRLLKRVGELMQLPALANIMTNAANDPEAVLKKKRAA